MGGVKSNVVDSMPDNLSARAVRLSMVVMMLGVYPINVKPMVAMIRSRSLVFLATPCIILTCMCLAFFVEDLGLINVLNGALCMGVWVTIGPALVGLYLLRLNRLAMMVLIAFGAMMSVLGCVFVSNYLDVLVSACLLW